jgi:hypothetical protein
MEPSAPNTPSHLIADASRREPPAKAQPQPLVFTGAGAVVMPAAPLPVPLVADMPAEAALPSLLGATPPDMPAAAMDELCQVDRVVRERLGILVRDTDAARDVRAVAEHAGLVERARHAFLDDVHRVHEQLLLRAERGGAVGTKMPFIDGDATEVTAYRRSASKGSGATVA